MALNAKKIQGSGGSRVEQPLLEPDVYRAILVQIIDLGLQPQRAYMGVDKPPANEVMLTYELVDEFMKDENGEDVEDKPRWISETIPLHPLVADKAKSTQRYYAFDPEEKFGGDFSKCLEVAVNVTLVNNKSGEKTYTNVANVASMSAKKAASMPELKNPSKFFDLDAPDLEVFNALPQWLQEKIKSNLNFNGSPLQKMLGQPAKDQEQPAKNERAAKQPDQNNNPF